MKEIVFGYEYWFRTALYNSKKTRLNGKNWKFIWGGGEEKGEGSGGENPVLMKAMIFFIVSHLHFEKQMALNRTN